MLKEEKKKLIKALKDNNSFKLKVYNEIKNIPEFKNTAGVFFMTSFTFCIINIIFLYNYLLYYITDYAVYLLCIDIIFIIIGYIFYSKLEKILYNKTKELLDEKIK